MTGGGDRRAILLGGVVGAGKTSVAIELAELLDGQSRSYAVVDLDWLAWFRPPVGSPLTVGAMLAANLGDVWANYERAGVERLVLVRCLRSADELEAIRGALAGLAILAIRLEVSRDVAAARVRARDRGSELEEHLAMIEQHAPGELFEDVAVRADTGSSRAVALDVLRLAGWG